jgi:L-ascorbate metabolism protein UlaG (beta-lactamase superfamily)
MRPERDVPLASFDLPAGRAPVRVTWLGTAGFRIEHEGATLLIDPYITRASLFACLRAPLRSDRPAVERYVPAADAIIAGHTHFDHALDVPLIARLTGAKVFGSRSCAALCRAEGLNDAQITDVETTGLREAEVGPFKLRFVPSAHSAFLFGRVPSPGDIADCDQVPMRTERYRCGAVFGVEISVAGRRIFHLGSANLVDANRAPDVDLLLMCVAGWTTTERFCDRVMSAFSPDAVMLSHWDNFFTPIEKGASSLPAMKIPTLIDRLTAIDRSVRVGAVPFFGHVDL